MTEYALNGLSNTPILDESYKCLNYKICLKEIVLDLCFPPNLIKRVLPFEGMKEYTREDLFHLLLECEINEHVSPQKRSYECSYYLRPKWFKENIEKILKEIKETKRINEKFISQKSNETQINNKIRTKLSFYRSTDKHKGRSNDLTLEWYKRNIYNKECIYCGSKKNVGCDRIDNTKGHLQSNCVPCCARCNLTRANRFSYEEMLELGKVIRKIDESRGKDDKYANMNVYELLNYN